MSPEIQIVIPALNAETETPTTFAGEAALHRLCQTKPSAKQNRPMAALREIRCRKHAAALPTLLPF